MDSLAVIGSIVGITSVVIALLVLSNSKNKDNMESERKREESERTQALIQKELEIKYTRIEADLAEIKSMLTCSKEQYASLEKRVFLIETRCEAHVKEIDKLVNERNRRKTND